MESGKNFVSVVVLLFGFLVNVCSTDNNYGLLTATCTNADDCYISNSLSLICSYEKNKCICYNQFHSNYNLKYENGQCLMSKYGPCGAKGDLVVGCRDGFVCVENHCRDPSDTKYVKVVPYIFTESECSQCGFDDLQLSCNTKLEKCECAKRPIADARASFWDIRSYDGNNNCSVGKFGPCGTKNGVTIDCHGDGITCVDGTCLNANHLVADVDEECAYEKNCKQGLLCSFHNQCIEPFSLEESKICTSDNECQIGLKCNKVEPGRPWTNSYCTK